MIQTEDDLKKLLELNTKEVMTFLIDILQKRRLIHETKDSFRNTETLLYNYNLFKESIKENNKEIEDLKKYGLPQKSKSIVIMSNGGLPEDENTKLQNRIRSLEEGNIIIQASLNKIDRLIAEYENPKYKGLINAKYKEGKTREELAEMFQCDVKTIDYNKNQFIKTVKVILFPSNSINELGW